GYVNLLGRHRSMQPLIEQQIRLSRQTFPWCESARRLPVGLSLLIIMQVLAHPALTVFAILAEQFLQFFEQIRLRAEVAKRVVTTLQRLSHLRLHLGTVVPVETVALDERRIHMLTPKDLLKSTHHQCRPGARR